MSGPATRHETCLIHARGLKELIVLNIGLRLGILSPSVFALFVVVALVTTLSTGLLPCPQSTGAAERPQG